jgi:curved DNA-binding protein CbpA
MQQKKGLTVDPETFKKIQEAFEYLKDPDNRALYNGKKNQQSLTNQTQLLLKNNNVNAKHWTEYREKKKNSNEEEVWYVNKKNPISLWKDELPKNAIIDVKTPDFWTIGESDDKTWFKLKDEYDHTIYFNKAENIHSWTPPEGVEIKDLAVRRLILSNSVKLPDPPENAA